MTAPASASSAEHLQPLGLGSALLALGCSALWGGVAVGSSFAQDVLPPLLTGALRFYLGGAFLVLWFLAGGVPLWPSRKELLPIAWTGSIVWLQIALFHAGMHHTSSSHTSVLIGTNPMWVPLLAHVVLPADRLSARKLLGVALAALGVVLVMGPAAAAQEGQQRDPVSWWGDALVLLSAWLLTVKIVYNKVVLCYVHPVRLVVWSNLLAAVLLTASSAALEPWQTLRLTWPALWGLLYAGVVISGVCFALWSALLQRHRASHLSVFGFAQPLFGVLFGWALRGDELTTWLVWGTVAVACGIVLVTWKEGP